MAKFKLPEPLKAWKVLQRLDDVNDNAVYKVIKKEIDGSTTSALLTGVSVSGEDYNDDNVEYLLNEADFIQSIIDIGRVSNYIAVATSDNGKKKKFDLFIVTEDIPSLSEVLGTKQMDGRPWHMVPGSWFTKADLDQPEYCGYFPRQAVADYLSNPHDVTLDESDMIPVEEYRELPEEEKKAYQYTCKKTGYDRPENICIF